MRGMKRPPKLRVNDRAVILSPAGSICGETVYKAASILQGWGLRLEVAEHALCEVGRFSGSIQQRLSDLQKSFDDPSLKLIFCSRGGYGTVHLLDQLDFSGMIKHPKWLVGYSDITVLHIALQSKGIASIHAPMAQHLADEGADDEAVCFLHSVLFGDKVRYEIPVERHVSLNRSGTANGRTFGGNLSVFCGLLGSKYVTIPKGGILIIEDIGESPYRVDRMIYQLKLAGIFDRIGGLAVGRFSDYLEDSQMYFPLKESIAEVVKDYDFPVCFDFPAGHVKANFPIVMGGMATMTVREDIVLFSQSKI